jgi:hypothetical protein
METKMYWHCCFDRVTLGRFNKPFHLTGVNRYLRVSMEVGAMLHTMVIEPVRAFNGMDVLVALDEGLFAAEGLDLQFASREPGDLRSTADGTLEQPVSAQGLLQKRGAASMYPA